MADVCGARAVGGPCVLPAGHNMGRPDIPVYHRASDLRERIEKVLTDFLCLDPANQGLHGWRCQYPDRWPEPCGHGDELIDALIEAITNPAPQEMRVLSGEVGTKPPPPPPPDKG